MMMGSASAIALNLSLGATLQESRQRLRIRRFATLARGADEPPSCGSATASQAAPTSIFGSGSSQIGARFSPAGRQYFQRRLSRAVNLP